MEGPSKARKTRIRLSDGRELIYYDEDPAAERAARDRRALPPTIVHSEVRRDPLRDEWVIVASHRQGRTHLPPAALCPLCPSTEERQTEIPSADYDVVVFENRFPSLTDRTDGVEPGDDLVPRRPGMGRCEVVCFTADHDASFGSLATQRLRTVVDVWADRTLELSALPGVEHVFPFENRGEEIGVTLHHPHGPIYAYPFVAPVTGRMLEVARRHREQVGGCLFCAVIEAEVRGAVRVTGRPASWIAFVPAAAHWPFEVHLYSTRHLPDLPALDDADRDGLVRLLKDVLARFDGLFGKSMPYMATWHLAPGTGARRPRPRPPAPRDLLHSPVDGQVEVPGLERVRGRRLDQRRRPRACCRDAASGAHQPRLSAAGRSTARCAPAPERHRAAGGSVGQASHRGCPRRLGAGSGREGEADRDAYAARPVSDRDHELLRPPGRRQRTGDRRAGRRVRE
jgi:UDPglucose--hexose-1-phosphate uridylyltransferase